MAALWLQARLTHLIVVVRCSLIYHCCSVWYAMYIVILLFTVCFCSVCC